MPAVTAPSATPESTPVSVASATVLSEVQVELRRLTLHAFASVPHGGLEIGGVLLGVEDNGEVRVLAAVPMDLDRSLGPRFVLSESDRPKFHALFQESDTDGVRPVGWFCSHTRSDLALRAWECDFWRNELPSNAQLALVLKPEGIDLVHAQLWNRSGSSMTDPFLLARAASAAQPVQPPAAPIVKEVPGSAAVRTSLGWRLPALCIMLALGLGAGVFAWSSHREAVEPTLTVEPTGEFLVLRWKTSPSAKAVRIRIAPDRAPVQELPVDAASGILVVPHPKRGATFTQMVVSRSGETVQNTVYYVSQLPAPTANEGNLDYWKDRSQRLEALVIELRKRQEPRK